MATEALTDVGTPRSQTLIVEPDDGVCQAPGQFNPYMSGTRASWGAHQIMWCDGLWDLNTMTGETIPTVAADLAVPNEDYTEWTITIRDGLKWSDGHTLDANDVVFTFDLIMNTEGVVDKPYYNSLFEKSELIDDLTLKIYCKAPFTRIMTTLGVNAWGCGFRVVPKHVYSEIDVLTFTDSAPLAADAYIMKEYDPLGTWILYEKRADWADTPTGKVWGEPGPQYILYRVFGSQESRVMAMINNEVDIMNEVAYEDLKVMIAQNPNVQAWYPDFPYANTDDACAKGLFFNTGVAPFDNFDVRWALTLCCDFIEISANIFEGVGRMSALQVPAITAMENFYYKPMSEWLTNDFTILDGYNPWDPDFALKLAAALVDEFGYDLSAYNDDDLKTMFGSGYWKTDKEKAAAILEANGYELKDGKWYTADGDLFTVNVTVCPEEASTQASRSGKTIADQWEKFGITVALTQASMADMFDRINIGDFGAASSWDACSGYRVDFYNSISGWNDEAFSYELGEKATGISSYRLPQSDPERSAKISELVRHLATLDPNGDECYEALTEFLKLTAEVNIGIKIHAGTKIVPSNSTYWTGYPNASDPYEGPWWWWSLFRGIVTKITPVAQ